MGDLINEYSDDPDDVDPFAHLVGRTYVRGGSHADLHGVATDAWNVLQSQGRLSYDDLVRVCPVTSGRGGEIVMADYYLEFIRDQFVERENDHLPNIEIEGGVTVDLDVAVREGYLETRTDSYGRESVHATDKLKREVVNDVVDDSWDYSRTAGFGRDDDTLERYVGKIVREFVRFAEALPSAAAEIEREMVEQERLAGIIRRDIERVYEGALPQLEHAGFRWDEEYALVAPAVVDAVEEAETEEVIA